MAAGSTLGHLSLFCRHNRFTAECPICSKGTVLDPAQAAERRPRTGRGGRPGGDRRRAAAAPAVHGPYGAAGPYRDAEGSYEVRLERVPGGLRLAAWAAGRMRRAAPVLHAADLPRLVAGAAERGALRPEEAEAMLAPARGSGAGGASPGRSGELRDELRFEPLEGGRVRVARWIMRPNAGWELQESPVMLPAARFVEALASGRPDG